MQLILASLMILSTYANTAVAELDAKSIMEKNESARKIDGMQSTSRLSTGVMQNGKLSNAKVKEFTLWRKKHEDGIRNKTFTRFHAPAEVRNEGILIVENETGRNDVLIYLPNFKKIRRVETQQQSGSFMGSAFSYSDIATPHVDDYQYKKLRTEGCPTEEAKGIQCAVIESKPANEDIRDRTGYSQSTLWIRSDNYMLVQAEHLGLDGKLFKKLRSSQIKMVDEKNKKWNSNLIEIENLKTNEYTRLEFLKVKVNESIPNSIFTQQNLQKVN